MKNRNERTNPPVCLSIAGLDPSGGAGVLADVRAFAAFGCFPSAAVTSITFQNTMAVLGAEAQTAETVRSQIVPVFEDYDVAAVKTGMLPTREVIDTVAALMEENKVSNLVVDPVVRSTSGFDLIDDAALRALIEKLFPASTLITPNIQEAERIAGLRILTEEEVARAALEMLRMGAANVLIKGGHLPDDIGSGEKVARDYLFLGEQRIVLKAPYIDTDATHGTGCVLSSSIAAGLALGRDLEQAVRSAKEFVNNAIRTAPLIGQGHSPINLDPDNV